MRRHNLLGVAFVALAAAPIEAHAEEWDDPKSPELLGMRAEWFRAEPAPAAEPARAAVVATARAAAPAWDGDDSRFNPGGPERGRAGAGKLDQQLIKEAIQPHMGEVKFCFAREQATHPELAGRVVVKFTIGDGGNVSASDVESSSVDSAAVERCVVAAVKRWSFPPPRGGSVTVTWPFKFVAMQ